MLKMDKNFEPFLVKFFINSLISFYKKLDSSEERFGIACAFFENYFGNDLLGDVQKHFLNFENELAKVCKISDKHNFEFIHNFYIVDENCENIINKYNKLLIC